MEGKDWLLDHNGQCRPLKLISSSKQIKSPYRLYRFLTDLEDILDNIDDDCKRLRAIAPLVRLLLNDCWGLVALLNGQEKNRFWQRNPQPQLPDRIQEVGEQILDVGDIICFLPSAIHQVEAMGNQPTISFNLYGETDFDSRFEFDPIQGTAKKF